MQDQTPLTAPRWRIREPFNGLSHLFGAALSLIGMIALVAYSLHKPWHVTGFLVYGASMVTLYAASTLYHSLPVGPHKVKQLLVFDQVAIYLLIAGTYTPICLVPLRGPWGWSTLGAIWTVAITGVVLRIFWKKAPIWLPVVLYLLMGWVSVTLLK